MRKSGQYFLLSKKLKNGSLSQQYFAQAPYHPLTIACVIPLMPSILKVCDKIKTETPRWTFIFANHSSNECNKKEVVAIDKKFNCLQLRFSQTIDGPNGGQLL